MEPLPLPLFFVEALFDAIAVVGVSAFAIPIDTTTFGAGSGLINGTGVETVGVLFEATLTSDIGAAVATGGKGFVGCNRLPNETWYPNTVGD